MERLSPTDFAAFDLSRFEHGHRYRCASLLVKGRVLDMACGIGYGAAIIERNAKVTGYVGVDVDLTSVEEAARTYGNPARHYLRANGAKLPFADGSFDSVVSMETIEHVLDPAAFVAEVRRVLRPGGLLIGSVPTRRFDEFAEQMYGPNPFHLHRFDQASLSTLLAASFAYAEIHTAILGIAAAVLKPGTFEPVGRALDFGDPGPDALLGSYLFVASDHDLADVLPVEWPVTLGLSYFAQERHVREGLVGPLDGGVSRLDQLGHVVATADALLAERDAAVIEQDALITERDTVVIKQDAMIAERDGVVIKQDAMIAEQARSIANGELLLRALEARIAATRLECASLQTELATLQQASRG